MYSFREAGLVSSWGCGEIELFFPSEKRARTKNLESVQIACLY